MAVNGFMLRTVILEGTADFRNKTAEDHITDQKQDFHKAAETGRVGDRRGDPLAVGALKPVRRVFLRPKGMEERNLPIFFMIPFPYTRETADVFRPRSP